MLNKTIKSKLISENKIISVKSFCEISEMDKSIKLYLFFQNLFLSDSLVLQPGYF